MLNIVWHNLRISVLFMVLVIPVWAMGALSTSRHGDAYFWWCQVFVLGLIGLPDALRWQAGSDRLIHSLPVSRRDVVRGHALTAVILMGAGCALAAALASGLAWLSWSLRGVWPNWVDSATAMAFLAVAVPMVALQLVAFHRWAAGWASGVVAVVLIVVFMGIQLVWAGAAGGALTGAGGLVDLARALTRTLGSLLVWVGGGAGAAAVLAGALWVSERLYAKREF